MGWISVGDKVEIAKDGGAWEPAVVAHVHDHPSGDCFEIEGLTALVFTRAREGVSWRRGRPTRFTQEQARYLASAAQTLAVASKDVEEALRNLAKAAHEESISLGREVAGCASASGREDARAASADAHEAFKVFTKLADVLMQARRDAQVEVR